MISLTFNISANEQTVNNPLTRIMYLYYIYLKEISLVFDLNQHKNCKRWAWNVIRSSARAHTLTVPTDVIYRYADQCTVHCVFT